VKPSRLGRWIACLSVAWLLVPVGSAHAERPDVFWMRGGHAHSIMAVQYSADGSMVASGGNDGTIKLWRAADGMLLRTLTGHQVPNPQLLATVQSVAFSPDGTLLASAGNDGTIFVWRVADGTVAQTLSAFIAGQNGCLSPCGLAFSPNGQMLGLGTAAGLQMGLRIWRVADWTVLFESSSYGAFSFSPDPSTPDRVAAMTSNGFKIIQIPSGAVLLSVTTGAPAGPTFSPDAQLIVAGAVYNALDGSLVSSPGASSFVFGGFAFSPDGQTLAFSGLEHDPAPAMTYHSVIKLFRRADLVNPSPAPIAVWSPHGGGQAVIAFSPDSQTLVSAGAIYQFQSNYILGLRLWSVPDGALVGLLAAYTNFVWKVALSPDGTTVTAASELTTGQTDPLGLNALRLWNAQTGDLTLTIPDLGQTGVAFSLDGQTLVSASALPSGENASVTMLLVCPMSGDPTMVPSATRRLTMLVPAPLVRLGLIPAATIVASGEKASAVTNCPYCSVVTGVRLIMSQIWTCLPSPMTAARRVRSLEMAKNLLPVAGCVSKVTEPSPRFHSWIELSLLAG